MKLKYANICIEKSSAEYQSESFSFGEDERALFEMFRSKIYSNPPYTVCQEVMSNARDAHTEVGKLDTPIEVKLPNKLDPSFWVKDYGPGINPDRMYNVCVKYGVSTKRKTDLQIGGWGLGFKSPFSYSPTFTILTVANEEQEDGSIARIKRQYVAHIGKAGKGQMLCQSWEPTDENTGTTIIISIQPKDFAVFAASVKKIARFWKTRPIIHGSTEWEWPKNETTAQGRGWSLLKSEYNYSNSNKPVILVDEIPYPLNASLVSGEDDGGKDKQWSINPGLYNLPVVMTFRTGEIAVTANRESLDYQPETINRLRAALARVSRRLVGALEKEMGKCSTVREAIALYSEMVKDNRNQFAKNLNWRGAELAKFQGRGVQIVETEALKGIKIRTYSRADNKFKIRLEGALSYTRSVQVKKKIRKKSKQNTVQTKKTAKKIIRRGAAVNHEWRRLTYWQMRFDDPNTLYVEDDLGLKNVSRARLSTLLDQHPKARAIYVVSMGANPGKLRRELDRKWLWSLFFPVKLSSLAIKKFPKSATPANGGGTRKIRIRKFGSYYRDYWSHVWKEAEVDFNKTPVGVYLIYHNRVGYFRKGPTVNGCKQHSSDVPANLTYLRAMLDDAVGKDFQLYGILSSDVPRLPSGWIRLDEYIAGEIKKVKMKVDYSPKDKAYCLARQAKILWQAVNEPEFCGELDPRSLFRRYISASRRVEKHSKLIDRVEALSRAIPHKLKNPPMAPPIPATLAKIAKKAKKKTKKKAKKSVITQSATSNLWTKVRDKYPMLFELDTKYRVYPKRVVGEILAYIQWKDSLPEPAPAPAPKKILKSAKKMAKKKQPAKRQKAGPVK
jgi:hypothetical protein